MVEGLHSSCADGESISTNDHEWQNSRINTTSGSIILPSTYRDLPFTLSILNLETGIREIREASISLSTTFCDQPTSLVSSNYLLLHS